MTNSQKRRIHKEGRREARAAEVEAMRQTQQGRRTPQPKLRSASGCQKRRRRKHRIQGVSLMQSKKGYLRPYYPWEFAALAKGER